MPADFYSDDHAPAARLVQVAVPVPQKRARCWFMIICQVRLFMLLSARSCKFRWERAMSGVLLWGSLRPVQSIYQN